MNFIFHIPFLLSVCLSSEVFQFLSSNELIEDYSSVGWSGFNAIWKKRNDKQTMTLGIKYTFCLKSFFYRKVN